MQMKDTVIQTTWRTVFSHIPPVKPKRIRCRTPEEQEILRQKKKEYYHRTYVTKRKPKAITEVAALDTVPRKLVEVVDYPALIERLKQGPMLLEAVDIENTRQMLRYNKTLVITRTVHVIVDGVQKAVQEVRIKE
jgi:hypothetical protein